MAENKIAKLDEDTIWLLKFTDSENEHETVMEASLSFKVISKRVEELKCNEKRWRNIKYAKL